MVFGTREQGRHRQRQEGLDDDDVAGPPVPSARIAPHGMQNERHKDESASAPRTSRDRRTGAPPPCASSSSHCNWVAAAGQAQRFRISTGEKKISPLPALNSSA